MARYFEPSALQVTGQIAILRNDHLSRQRLKASCRSMEWRMVEDWTSLLRRYRLRHGLTQQALADISGVSQRTISRWEGGDDQPTKAKQSRLRDLGLDPPPVLLANLSSAVRLCPAPHALSKLQLLSVSGAAVAKRPSVANLLSHDLVRLATSVLTEMSDDSELQRGIRKREIGCVRSTTSSVL
jgi:transcriptional regulator with XRE-family HTH domain